jgi:uncharacterized protein
MKRILMVIMVLSLNAAALGNDPNVKVLKPNEFEPLPLTSIRPASWLENQLRIQADGLSGHLHEFWPDIRNSGWIGGSAEGWERGPYWLDGFVPLAYLLDDARLKTEVVHWMDYIISHQQPDGWLGPLVPNDHNKEGFNYDPWPQFIILKVLTQYAEASNDPRAIPAIVKSCRKLNTLLDTVPLAGWAKARWSDCLVSVYWLYDRDPQPWLLDLAAKLKNQGLDWKGHFADFKYKEKMLAANVLMETHGVNNAMSLKAFGLWSRQSNDPTDREAPFMAMNTLDKYHGQATDIFTCDENYAGKNPSQGTELCTVVEYMYSLEVLSSVLGRAELGDRLERITFNNLPATFKSDMWAHQYDQQANQVICNGQVPFIFVNDGAESNIFGLEPNFGCCTANMHQGWPKFTSHLWMKKGKDGLAAAAYAPCAVSSTVNGVPVHIDVQTEYPFSDTITFIVKAKQDSKFSIYLRIPAWTQNPSLTIGYSKVKPTPGTYHRIERTWDASTRITLTLPMPVKIQRCYHDSVAIERGPLVYALKVPSTWKLYKGELPHADWQVFPSANWNYAIALDTKNPAKSLDFKFKGIGKCPFSPDGAPIEVKAKGKLLPQWKIESNAAGPLPQSPVDSNQPWEKLTLIPYGCTDLRITEFPLLGS